MPWQRRRSAPGLADRASCQPPRLRSGARQHVGGLVGRNAFVHGRRSRCQGIRSPTARRLRRGAGGDRRGVVLRAVPGPRCGWPSRVLHRLDLWSSIAHADLPVPTSRRGRGAVTRRHSASRCTSRRCASAGTATAPAGRGRRRGARLLRDHRRGVPHAEHRHLRVRVQGRIAAHHGSNPYAVLMRSPPSRPTPSPTVSTRRSPVTTSSVPGRSSTSGSRSSPAGTSSPACSPTARCWQPAARRACC